MLIPTYVHVFQHATPFCALLRLAGSKLMQKRRTPYLAPSASLLPSCQNGTVYPFSVPTARRTTIATNMAATIFIRSTTTKGATVTANDCMALTFATNMY